MKKILSIFSLVLCAITLPLGLVGCKKVNKQNGPEYIIGKTYKFESFEATGLSEEEMASEEKLFSGYSFIFTANTMTISNESYGEEMNETTFYKVNEDCSLNWYEDEGMQTLVRTEEGSTFLLYFSNNYKKFTFKIIYSETEMVCGTYVVC